jgi:hypothetical protein
MGRTGGGLRSVLERSRRFADRQASGERRLQGVGRVGRRCPGRHLIPAAATADAVRALITAGLVAAIAENPLGISRAAANARAERAVRPASPARTAGDGRADASAPASGPLTRAQSGRRKADRQSIGDRRRRLARVQPSLERVEVVVELVEPSRSTSSLGQLESGSEGDVADRLGRAARPLRDVGHGPARVEAVLDLVVSWHASHERDSSPFRRQFRTRVPMPQGATMSASATQFIGNGLAASRHVRRRRGDRCRAVRAAAPAPRGCAGAANTWPHCGAGQREVARRHHPDEGQPNKHCVRHGARNNIASTPRRPSPSLLPGSVSTSTPSSIPRQRRGCKYRLRKGHHVDPGRRRPGGGSTVGHAVPCVVHARWPTMMRRPMR